MRETGVFGDRASNLEGMDERISFFLHTGAHGAATAASYLVPIGVTMIYVSGSGGGGGGQGGGIGSNVGGEGGAGAGSLGDFPLVVTPGETLTLSIGGGGIAGAAASGNGGNGVATTIIRTGPVTLLNLSGGQGGNVNGGSPPALGGAVQMNPVTGGNYVGRTSGDTTGESGADGSGTVSGKGGSSQYGQGGGSLVAAGVGLVGNGFGAGGSGGHGNTNAGSPGAHGFLKIRR